MGTTAEALKRLFVGSPKSSGELAHTLLPKTIALPVFSSDPLSSNAYATQEALLVLALAGSAGLSLILPISIAVATLLVIVVTSYRQTVRAYPLGGGAYRVAHENLGMYPGLEIEDSPFRDIGSSLTHYVRRFKADGVKRVVTIILPEFIVPKRRHRLLHNQTALMVKGRMLLEEGVIVVSVPYHLED